MNYPQPLGGPYGAPGPYPPQFDSGEKTGRVTGIIAGILALLGSAVLLISAVAAVVVLTGNDANTAYRIAQIASCAVTSPLLASGGGFLLARKPVGSRLVVAGSGCAIVVFLALGIWGIAGGAADGAATLPHCVPAAATLVLAVVPPTGRWIRERSLASQPMPASFPPQPQVQQSYPPQPQQPWYPQQGNRPPGW